MTEAAVWHRYAVTPGVGQVFFAPDQLRLIGETAGANGRIEMNVCRTPAAWTRPWPALPCLFRSG